MKRSNEPNSARWMTNGAMLGVVGAHVGEAEALRHLPVELDRAELPRAAERVAHVQVDLRPVERRRRRADEELDPVPLERRLELALGEVPLRVGAELVVGTRRELRRGSRSKRS